LLVAQIFLGIGSYLMKLAARDAPQPLLPVVAVTTTHVAVGALVLAASLVVTLETYRHVTAAKVASLADAGDELAGVRQASPTS
jgi:cytochrome c oxidase assembly protein subunit 15